MGLITITKKKIKLKTMKRKDLKTFTFPYTRKDENLMEKIRQTCVNTLLDFKDKYKFIEIEEMKFFMSNIVFIRFGDEDEYAYCYTLDDKGYNELQLFLKTIISKIEFKKCERINKLKKIKMKLKNKK
jgi:hypothetical protein